MPSFGSNKDVVKRDMNFFAEFTANAAKMTRMLGYGVFAGIVVVLAIVAVIVYGAIRNVIMKAAITDLQNTLASEEYAGLEGRAAELQNELNDKNNYYYVLSQMREQVDTTKCVSMQLPDKIKNCIPSDSYVENYRITQSSLHIDGYSFSYYSVLNMVNMLNKSDVFSAPVTLSINRVAPSSVGTPSDFIDNGINNYYQYQVEGVLTSEVYVSVSRYSRDVNGLVSSLGAVETNPYSAGDSYSIEGVATFVQSGVTYNLESVLVNNAGLNADEVNAIVANDRIDGLANGDVSIQLYYTVAPAEGGQ